MDLDNLNQWLGKEQVIEAVISADTVNLMQATLNRDPSFEPGSELPPAWHWLYFHVPARANDLGVEGHPKLGSFLPPIDFGDDKPPRRMWAGGKFEFERPIVIGDHATKHSTLKSITPKQGRSGRLMFVVVEHQVLIDGQRCLREHQTIVYREPAQTGEGAAQVPPAPEGGEFSAKYKPDPVMLFRYSALTFNGHRIHYDVDFCRKYEGYPDLVVHGPLTATLILDLFYHHYPQKQIIGFEYRSHSPLFNPNPFTVWGKANGQAWASNHMGGVAMSGQIQWGQYTF